MYIGIPTFGTDHGKSGIGSYLRELLIRFDALAEQEGFTFELIGPQEDEAFYRKGLSHIGWLGVEDADKSPIHNFFWNQTHFPSLVKKRGYDLVFFPAANRRLSGRLCCPTVGTVHDLAVLHIKEKYDFVHSFFNRKILPHLIRKLDHIVTVSEFSKRDIVRFVGVRDELVTVTHLAADQSRFTPAHNRAQVRSDLAKRFGLEQRFVLYISRLEHPGKNHVNLIKAFNLARDLMAEPFSLVLPGPDKERSEEIHAEASRSAYVQDIHFLGFVDWIDIPLLYQGASLFVLPSRFEGFGLPVLEAMASATAVITSDAASLVEIGGPQTPRFDPDDCTAMAKLMVQLLSDEKACESLVETNLKWASTFSWERTTAQTLDVFRTTSANRTGRKGL